MSYFNSEASAPELYLTQEEWAALKNKLDDPFFTKVFANITEALERMMKEKEEKGKLWGGHRAFKTVIQFSAVAWHITGEKKYLEFGLWGLDQVLDREWKPTHVNGIRGADLSTGELMYSCAFGFDAFWSVLSDEKKASCIENLIENGLNRYFAGIEKGDWWRVCDFNWNSALHGNAGVAAYAIRDHAPDISKKALEQALYGLPFMIDGCFEGGGWTEGLMYFGTAFGHLIDFIYLYDRFEGKDLGVVEDQNLQDTIDFVFNMHGHDGRPYNISDMFADGFLWSRPQAYWYADRCKRDDWTGWLEKAMLGRKDMGHWLFTDVDSFWYRKKNAVSEEYKVNSGLTVYNGIEWGVWNGESSWGVFRGGFNGGNHDNFDLGHFIYGIGKDRFLIDPGYGAKRADMHNCATFKLQDQSEHSNAPILETEDRENGFYLCCNLQECYPHLMEYYYRHLLLVEDDTFIIVDEAGARHPHRNDAQYNLQTHFPAEETESGFVIHGNERDLFVILPEGFYNKRIEQWAHGKGMKGPKDINRMIWYEEYYRTQSVMTVILSPASKWTISAGKDQVIVVHGEDEYKLPLKRPGWDGNLPK